MLFACLYIPDFPVQVALRNTNCDLAKQPAVILDGPESLLKVCAVNEAARRCGIERGMTRLQVETCTGVVLCKRSSEQEETAQAALLDCAYGFSPRVESAAPGTIILDLASAERLLGSPQQIGHGLQRRAKECDFIANIGVAANPDTSLHAAIGMRGISVIAAGQEAARLAPLPIEVLSPDASILDVLDSWAFVTLDLGLHCHRFHWSKDWDRRGSGCNDWRGAQCSARSFHVSRSSVFRSAQSLRRQSTCSNLWHLF